MGEGGRGGRGGKGGVVVTSSGIKHLGQDRHGRQKPGTGKTDFLCLVIGSSFKHTYTYKPP